MFSAGESSRLNTVKGKLFQPDLCTKHAITILVFVDGHVYGHVHVFVHAVFLLLCAPTAGGQVC